MWGKLLYNTGPVSVLGRPTLKNTTKFDVLLFFNLKKSVIKIYMSIPFFLMLCEIQSEQSKTA